MGIKKEYLCLAHGGFESADDQPLCPMGCDTVERAFFTPPAFGSARTKNIDATLQGLAKSHNLTDIGPAAMRRKALAAEKSQEAFREFCQKKYGGLGWGATPQGGNLNVQTGQVKGDGAGAMGALAHAHAAPSLTASEIGQKLGGPLPANYIRDPDSLTVPVAA